MKKCKCGNDIPEKRFSLGYTTCINCSDIKQVKSIDVTYHKTGNTIEVLPSDIADEINRKSSRVGFGIMNGMKSTESGLYNPKNIKFGASNNFFGATEFEYQQIGEEMLEIYDILGMDESMNFINLKFQKNAINLWQKSNLVKSLKLIIENEKH